MRSSVIALAGMTENLASDIMLSMVLVKAEFFISGSARFHSIVEIGKGAEIYHLIVYFNLRSPFPVAIMPINTGYASGRVDGKRPVFSILDVTNSPKIFNSIIIAAMIYMINLLCWPLAEMPCVRDPVSFVGPRFFAEFNPDIAITVASDVPGLISRIPRMPSLPLPFARKIADRAVAPNKAAILAIMEKPLDF